MLRIAVFWERMDRRMEKNQAEERARQLRESLEYHNNRYYNMDSPEISDFEYDTMMRDRKSTRLNSSH